MPINEKWMGKMAKIFKVGRRCLLEIWAERIFEEVLFIYPMVPAEVSAIYEQRP